MVDEEGDEGEGELKEVKEDAVVGSAEFRHWRSLCKANSIAMELLA